MASLELARTLRSCGDAPHTLRDAFGRHLHYLRLSVTDRCNFKCVYCLPQGCPRSGDAPPLSREEIGRLVRALAGLGFWKVRLTGGEPTLRGDICELVGEVAGTPGIRKLGLTTNGYRLASIARDLRDAGLTSVNVSVDSLDPARFERVTGSPRLAAVLQGVDAALAAGLAVKVNAVLLRGLEGDDLGRFLDWTRTRPLTVRFIELMETRDNAALFRDARLPAAEVRRELEARGWTPVPREAGDGPAACFAHADHAGNAGLISAYAPGFCASCNRLRVSSAGDLKLCLFGDRTLSLRPLLRSDADGAALRERIVAAVAEKPAAHDLGAGRWGTTVNLAATGG